jgi:hypothetical protein
MNLADWLKGDHEPSERLRAVETLCRAVSDSSKSLDLDPAHIQMSGDDCRPSEGKAVPSGRYRPPEMAQGGPPVPQSQVFTVGVLCFEMLSGRDFESRGGPLLRDLRPDLPRDVSDAVQACLEMDAEWRPKDVSYLLGQIEGLAASGGTSSKPASRGGRAASTPATPVNRARRGGPAPKPWPLLAFALVALAVSVGIAVFRLRQPVEAPPLPPAPSAPPATAPSAAPVTTPVPSPSAVASRPVASVASAAPSPRVVASAAPSARPVAATPAPTPVAVAAAPTSTLAAATPPPVTAPAEPAAPAAVTNVSPPLLKRGANVLVDVHGVGLRSDHQARISRPKEAVKGVEVMRQRYVNATLMQVLLHVDAGAPTGGYFLSLVDGTGAATNARPFEVGK